MMSNSSPQIKQTNPLFRRSFAPNFRKGRSSHKSMLQQEDYELSEVEITPQVLTFYFRGGHSHYLYNRQLRIANKSGTSIVFHIKSNNPQNYEVYPHREIIENNRTCEIRIKLFVTSKNLAKYNDDKFLIQWNKYDQLQHFGHTQQQQQQSHILENNHTQIVPQFQQNSHVNLSIPHSQHRNSILTAQQQHFRKMLKVKIESEKLDKETQKQQKKNQEKQIVKYKEMLHFNVNKIKQLDQLIEIREKAPTKHYTWVTKSLMITSGIIMFGVGYFIG